MTILTTPTHHFDQIPDYPFAPNYVSVGENLQMHYVDEGDKNAAEVVLCLHGEPSWSFLYRKMIPVFIEAGYRVIAPDLIGFGKSSKPTEQSDYTYARHLLWMEQFLEKLDLKDINLFCQDWGGLIGLRLITAHEERFSRVVAANTMLPTGEHQASEAFLKWREFSQTVPVLPVGKILQHSTTRALTDEEIAAYNAPFPEPQYQAGAKIFPALVPTSTDDPESGNNKAAWQQLKRWKKPFLTLFSDSDPIMKGGERVFQKLVPGTKGQPHQIIKDGGHFLQEDKGVEIAKIMVKWMKGL